MNLGPQEQYASEHYLELRDKWRGYLIRTYNEFILKHNDGSRQALGWKVIAVIEGTIDFIAILCLNKDIAFQSHIADMLRDTATALPELSTRNFVFSDIVDAEGEEGKPLLAQGEEPCTEANPK